MTDRERLIELKINFVENFDCGDCKPSNDKCRKCLSEKEADYLLENGVIVLPCKVGDTVFCIVCYPSSMKISVSEGFVREICFTKEHININIVDCECVRYANLNINVSCEDFGKTVFLTREDAEKALKERDGS